MKLFCLTNIHKTFSVLEGKILREDFEESFIRNYVCDKLKKGYFIVELRVPFVFKNID